MTSADWPALTKPMSEIMASTSRRLSAGTIDISLLGGRDDAADGVQCKLLHLPSIGERSTCSSNFRSALTWVPLSHGCFSGENPISA